MNKIIIKQQYGFTMGKSCMSQLICHFERLITILEESDNVEVLYLDFSTAFYKICHTILLKKLKEIGISGKIHQCSG